MKDKRIIILDFVLTLVATFGGVFLAFYLSNYQIRLNEEQIYKEKVNNFLMELEGNITYIDGLLKRQLIYVQNGKVYKNIPEYRMDTTMAESLLQDSNTTKYLHPKVISLFRGYVNDMKAANFEIDYDIARIENGSFSKQDKDVFNRELRSHLSDTLNTKRVIDQLLKENKVIVKYDPGVDNIIREINNDYEEYLKSLPMPSPQNK